MGMPVHFGWKIPLEKETISLLQGDYSVVLVWSHIPDFTRWNSEGILRTFFRS